MGGGRRRSGASWPPRPRCRRLVVGSIRMSTRMRAGWRTCSAWVCDPQGLSPPRPNGRDAMGYAHGRLWSGSPPPMSAGCRPSWRVLPGHAAASHGCPSCPSRPCRPGCPRSPRAWRSPGASWSGTVCGTRAKRGNRACSRGCPPRRPTRRGSPGRASAREGPTRARGQPARATAVPAWGPLLRLAAVWTAPRAALARAQAQAMATMALRLWRGRIGRRRSVPGVCRRQPSAWTHVSSPRAAPTG
jgi:hypothetical protein